MNVLYVTGLWVQNKNGCYVELLTTTSFFCCDLALHCATKIFIMSNMHGTIASLSVSVDDDPGGATVWPSAA